jgi:hypothetical protein
MEMGLKKYLLITIPILLIVIFAFLAYFNVGGIGSSLSGVGGPFARGIYNLAIAPLNWALGGGWPTLAVFYLIGFVVVPFALAYAVWHYDWPYKITGATANSAVAGYDNTMKREPDEPERAQTPNA